MEFIQETPLREASSSAGTVLLNDSIYVKGNIEGLKPTYTSTDYVSLVRAKDSFNQSTQSKIPSFFFCIGSIRIPLNPKCEMLPTRTVKSTESNCITLSWNDGLCGQKTLHLLFLDSHTFKDWHKTIRKSLTDVIIARALYPKNHGKNIHVHIIREALKKISPFAPTRDTSPIGRAKHLLVLKPRLSLMKSRIFDDESSIQEEDLIALKNDTAIFVHDPLVMQDEDANLVLSFIPATNWVMTQRLHGRSSRSPGVGENKENVMCSSLNSRINSSLIPSSSSSTFGSLVKKKVSFSPESLLPQITTPAALSTVSMLELSEKIALPQNITELNQLPLPTSLHDATSTSRTTEKQFALNSITTRSIKICFVVTLSLLVYSYLYTVRVHLPGQIFKQECIDFHAESNHKISMLIKSVQSHQETISSLLEKNKILMNENRRLQDSLASSASVKHKLPHTSSSVAAASGVCRDPIVPPRCSSKLRIPLQHLVNGFKKIIDLLFGRKPVGSFLKKLTAGLKKKIIKFVKIFV